MRNLLSFRNERVHKGMLTIILFNNSRVPGEISTAISTKVPNFSSYNYHCLEMKLNLFSGGACSHFATFELTLLKSSSWCSFTKEFKGFSIQDINRSWENFIVSYRSFIVLFIFPYVSSVTVVAWICFFMFCVFFFFFVNIVSWSIMKSVFSFFLSLLPPTSPTIRGWPSGK